MTDETYIELPCDSIFHIVAISTLGAKMNNVRINQLLGNRGRLIQLLAVAILLSLGIGLISSAITAILNAHPLWIGAGGVISTTLGVILVAQSTLFSPAEEIKIGGILIFGDDEGRPIYVRNYRFAEEFHRNFSALVAENKAILKNWNDSNIEFNVEELRNVDIKSESYRNAVIREGVEYFLLDRLSTHLTDYFNIKEEKSQINTFKRSDVPEILLRNRFLELFSKPQEERESFIEHDMKPKEIPELPAGMKELDIGEGEVVWSSGRDGAIFSQFDLVLPNGSRVARVSPNKIRISTKRFDFDMRIVFGGFGANTGRGFEQLYLDRDIMTTSTYEVQVKLSVKHKPFSLLSRKGWDDFSWLDSFFDTIEDEFSFDVFMNKISWESNAALLHMMEVRNRKPRE
ncbi:hypothetical protein [Henriciella algicola]|uniref:Uncharacterized protein n=1 Tax=Henriciella algicola TaxID=1608422 RepID=A0A399RNE8_9PROT|nr:hypothetical protein [Henriciella algicola]RIJ31507.1 hypothetical protein D1222_04475 [Henriciella algicola]